MADSGVAGKIEQVVKYNVTTRNNNQRESYQGTIYWWYTFLQPCQGNYAIKIPRIAHYQLHHQGIKVLEIFSLKEYLQVHSLLHSEQLNFLSWPVQTLWHHCHCQMILKIKYSQ